MNKYGTPYILLTVFYIVGLVPIITGVSLSTISSIGSCAMLCRCLIPACAGFLIYKKYPDACKKSFFLFKPKVMYATVTVAAIVMLLQMKTLLSMQSQQAIVITICYVIVAFILSIIINKVHKVKLYSGDVEKDFRQD